MIRNRTLILGLVTLWGAGCDPVTLPDAGQAVPDVQVVADSSSSDAITDASSQDAAAADVVTADALNEDVSKADVASDATPADVPPSCSSGQALCGADCFDLQTSTANCGACGTQCNPAHATARCAMGSCQIASCETGFADCDMNAANGCEVNLNESAENCGACGSACSFQNAMGVCRMGTCAIGGCNTGFGDCDMNAANGCETVTATTVTSCGSCGSACSVANGTSGCAMGACTVETCNDGFGNCDMNAATGCETALNTNTNCGMCGNACAAGTRCAAGTCVSSCPTGTTYCDALQICVNLSSDATNCGMCGNACPSRANGTSTCTGGSCRLSCTSGFGDCDTNDANGCEVNLATTASHCGACGAACNLAHATAGCASGTCTIASCNAGFGDCDGNPANGCEVNLNSTVGACGACGSACSLPNATPACVAGRCGVASCNAGFADCDTSSENGCETSIATNSNCGACGAVCAAGTRCANGACVSSCPSGTTFCVATGVCADFTTDTANCGMCGTACPSLANASPTCSAGACGFVCNAGYADCDGNAANGCEASLGNSTTNCGACGNACRPTNAVGVCATGSCQVVACAAGFGDCDGNPANGCEVDLRSTANACGTCSNACRPSNGTGSCSNGVCAVASCEAGFGNCDMNAVNGCETSLGTNNNCGACGRSCAAGQVCSNGACTSSCPSMTSYCGNIMSCVDPRTDPLNCGGCGITCPVPANAISTCAASTCGISCQSGFANCDGNNGNGCEVNLNTNAASCGRCGAACSLPNATSACSAGACTVATCALNYGNCDGASSNGCEVNLSTSAANCGSCGTVCSYANAGANCASGACAIGACNTGFGNCDGRSSNGCETQLNTTNNCGACGNRCGNNQACSNGTCVSTCAGGTTLCSGSCVNLQTDPDNCNACGRACPSFANVVRTCMAGTCGGSCASGFGNCDMNSGNGCETNINTSVSHCGACGNACNLANANPVCVSGGCAIRSCNIGFANCDNNTMNGCEVNLATSETNCGACGRACTNGQTCRLGVCR